MLIKEKAQKAKQSRHRESISDRRRDDSKRNTISCKTRGIIITLAQKQKSTSQIKEAEDKHVQVRNTTPRNDHLGKRKKVAITRTNPESKLVTSAQFSTMGRSVPVYSGPRGRVLCSSTRWDYVDPVPCGNFCLLASLSLDSVEASAGGVHLDFRGG